MQKNSQKLDTEPSPSLAIHVPLPPERRSITHKFRVGGVKAYLTVGQYPNGKVGEVFLVVDRVGSLAHSAFGLVALMMSVALQHGVPLKTLTEKLIGVNGDPSGLTGNPSIPLARSIFDYIGRWLELKFLPKEDSTLPSSQGETR
jgi:ribonucleoside-diphosphate reductase alpha chain